VHLLLSVALSFTHTRRLMTTLALTRENPRLLSVFNGLFTYCEYHEGSQKKRHFQFGTGENGTPAELEINWSQPDAFKSRYTEEQFEKATKVDSDKFESNGKTFSARLMYDGFTIPAKVVAAISEEGKRRYESLGD